MKLNNFSTTALSSKDKKYSL